MPKKRCLVGGCKAAVIAKGFCHKHYARHRRSGVVSDSRRRGRPKDPIRTQFREMFSEWSDRTFARYWKASSIAMEQGIDIGPIIEAAGRKNGTANVAEIERLVEKALVRKLSKK